MPTGPPDPSPPVEADFGPSHDAITAELLDLTWQFLTHAAPTVRAELGQFLTDHGQHPVAGLGGPGVFDGRTETRKVNQWSVRCQWWVSAKLTPAELTS
jgi:hypothetical protein